MHKLSDTQFYIMFLAILAISISAAIIFKSPEPPETPEVVCAHNCNTAFNDGFEYRDGRCQCLSNEK